MELNKLYKLLLDILYIQVTKVVIQKNGLHIWCENKLESCHCPNCLQPRSEITSYYEREVQDLSVSNCKVHLHLTSRQFYCPDCNRYFQERFSFVSKHERMTKRFENFIYKRCIGVNLTSVSIQEDLCWATVNRIFTKWSNAKIASCNLLEGVRVLGIDEIALKKGYKDYV